MKRQSIPLPSNNDRIPLKRSRTLLCRPLLLLLLTGLNGSAAFAQTLTRWKGESQIEFSGTSTLHQWAGKVNSDPFVAQVTMDETNRPLTLKARVTVQAAKMDTAEPKRDENMHRNMQVALHPLITGLFDSRFERILRETPTPSKLPFTLTLLGKPLEVEGTIRNWSLNTDRASFDLDFNLSLKQCGIDVPSVLLFIRVGDEIKLTAHVQLTRIAN